MKNSVKLFLAMLAVTFYVSACKPKDETIQKNVSEAIKAVQGVTAEVKEGVVTLSGTVAIADAKTSAETAAKAVEGVKSVTNNITVEASPATAAPATVVTNNPVVNAADEVLSKSVKDAIKDFPSVKAAVKDGVVSLTGELAVTKWKLLKMSLDALKPKKVDASGLTVK
jgi:osmotically-inducible protein OsmY